MSVPVGENQPWDPNYTDIQIQPQELQQTAPSLSRSEQKTRSVAKTLPELQASKAKAEAVLKLADEKLQNLQSEDTAGEQQILEIRQKVLEIRQKAANGLQTIDDQIRQLCPDLLSTHLNQINPEQVAADSTVSARKQFLKYASRACEKIRRLYNDAVEFLDPKIKGAHQSASSWISSRLEPRLSENRLVRWLQKKRPIQTKLLEKENLLNRKASDLNQFIGGKLEQLHRWLAKNSGRAYEVDHQIIVISPPISSATSLAADPRDSSRLTTIPQESIQLISKIGNGSFGQVFSARWGSSTIAYKFPHPQIEAEEESRDMAALRKEVSIAQNLHHPNIVTCYGAVVDQSGQILGAAYEWCEKGDLKSFLESEEGKSLTFQDKVNLAADIASGMQYLASQGISHRDLAARNILLTRKDGRLVAKISDFGMSRTMEGEEKRYTRTDVGPLKWMSPESIAGTEEESSKRFEYSEKSDVWAFGVTLWELLTGEEPYGEMSPIAVATQVAQQSLTPGIPAEVIPEEWQPFMKALLENCWKFNPEERPTFKEINEWFQT